jgi:MFS transporter, OPA family, glycerol-3-phosphate transporter
MRFRLARRTLNLVRPTVKSQSLLFRWQTITLVTLWVGYAGYYVCRSDFSVAAKALQADLAEEPTGPVEEWLEQSRAAMGQWISGALGSARAMVGLSVPEAAPAAAKKKDDDLGKRRFGLILSVSILCYTLGKLFSGIGGDFLGGRRLFLLGMLGSIICTVLFGLSTGFATLLFLWCGNRLVQSVGWNGLVKVASRWYPVERHGAILGVLTLSYLFGDSLARVFLSGLLSFGIDWRTLFFAAAGLLTVVMCVSWFTLKSCPGDVGAPEPDANPANVYGAKGNSPTPASLFDLLWPLATDFSFWLVCVMSFGLTLIRETFNNWNPTYLQEVAGLGKDRAALASALFPFVGGLSAITAGVLTDRLTKGRRGVIIFAFLAIMVAALYGLSKLEPGVGATLPLILTSIVSFSMLGPYSFLTGVMSLDFGGKRGSSTAAGLADTAGYLGAVVSGYGVAVLAAESGWGVAFSALATVSTVTLFAAGLYWYLHDVRKKALRS